MKKEALSCLLRFLGGEVALLTVAVVAIVVVVVVVVVVVLVVEDVVIAVVFLMGLFFGLDFAVKQKDSSISTNKQAIKENET